MSIYSILLPFIDIWLMEMGWGWKIVLSILLLAAIISVGGRINELQSQEPKN